MPHDERRPQTPAHRRVQVPARLPLLPPQLPLAGRSGLSGEPRSRGVHPCPFFGGAGVGHHHRRPRRLHRLRRAARQVQIERQRLRPCDQGCGLHAARQGLPVAEEVEGGREGFPRGRKTRLRTLSGRLCRPVQTGQREVRRDDLQRPDGGGAGLRQRLQLYLRQHGHQGQRHLVVLHERPLRRLLRVGRRQAFRLGRRNRRLRRHAAQGPQRLFPARQHDLHRELDDADLRGRPLGISRDGQRSAHPARPTPAATPVWKRRSSPPTRPTREAPRARS